MLLPNFQSQLLLLQQGVANKQLLKNLSSEPRKQMQSVSPRRIRIFLLLVRPFVLQATAKLLFFTPISWTKLLDWVLKNLSAPL